MDQCINGSMHRACREGRLSDVRGLASNKFNLVMWDRKGCTPLMLAARGGHYNLVHALLSKYHCPVTGVDCDGWTVLHHACAGGSVEIVRTLVREHKAKVNVYNKHNDTPLHVAANTDVILCLVHEFGCDPNVAGNMGYTWLHYACKGNALDIVHALVYDCKADVNVCDEHANLPLHVAAEAGNYEVALALVNEFGCDPNAAGSKGYTLLHYACKWGAMDIVRALICDCKADVYVRDEQDDMPLHVAAKAGQYDIVLVLVSEFGCDPNAVGSKGYTLLHYTCETGAMDVMCVLINDFNADVNVCEKFNRMPLHVAAEAGESELVQALVSEFDSDPSALSHFKRTPLHLASYIGHNNVVKTLLKYSSPLVTDVYGNTPLHLAAVAGNRDCVESLVHANAPLLLRNSNGQTPADVAEGNSKAFLVKYIEENRHQLKIDYTTVLKHAKKKFSGSHPITRVFVLGNPGAGKSSFIQSLKREGFFQSFRKVSESSVPPHTAGIIPSIHMSKEYGRVLFYDFAGDVEYYSSHAAIFENLASSRKGDNIFILVVDLREDSATIETTLHYWFSFIQFQKFSNPSLIVVGSHVDVPSQHCKKYDLLNQFCSAVHSNVCRAKYFMLDCRDPRSNQIVQFKKQILTWVSKSQKYETTGPANLLLGLLEKDFGAVTAAPVQTLVSHIKDSGVCLPVATEPLYQVIFELHEVGALLLLGDYTKEYYHVILDISKLTNEVHELLFSETAASNIKKTYVNFNTAPLNIGILPEALLAEILPPYITKECLIHLQYCQHISHSDVGFFPSLRQADSTNQSFLFFPALCSVDKEVAWKKSTDNSFSIGWLALCTNPHDYFPSRFLHVLLLRLIYAFTLSVPAQLQSAEAPSENSHRCTMWKRGVHWLMEEGVDCMVEMVNGSKAMVVLSKSSNDRAEKCIGIFAKIVSHVLEAKTEYCFSTQPQFFLLDSTAEADYMNKDNLFALSDVERALECPEEKEVIISISGRGKMNLSMLECMRKFTHWESLFPMDFNTVLHTLKDIVRELYELGESLGASRGVLQAIEADFPFDVNRRRRELVRWWMSSYQDFPCWWHLMQALKRIDENVLAEKIRADYGLHIQLQEKLLDFKNQGVKPDEDFLFSLSGVVSSRWPSLAVSLLLSEGEIEELKKNVGLSHQELALQMLKIWASREEATYGQLCHKLTTISLFQCSCT